MSVGVRENFDIKINTYDFNEDVVKKLQKEKYGVKWPIVYIINNDKEAYIGETINAYVRASQHLENPKRKKLEVVNIIGSDKFNKSAILDLESFLIKYMAADNKFKLQNANNGLKNHNYYQKELYEKQFKRIWEKLKRKGIVQNDLLVIENSDLFKYSPYKSLADDQYKVVMDILTTLSNDVKENKKSSFIVHGGPGTGKTILAIYLIKLLVEIKENNISLEEDFEEEIKEILNINESINKLKIGLVVPMNSLRKTIKKVFKNVSGLKQNMVLSPIEIAKSKEKYDLLIVDETHRLRKRKSLSNYAIFDNYNNKFGLGNEGTELDWIKLQSKYQIFLYDENQTVRPSDINKNDIINLENQENNHRYELNTQLRCILGGNEYIEYVNRIFSNNPPTEKKKFDKYDFKLFTDVDEMINNIKAKDKEYGLCRNIAGYAWKWNTQKEGGLDYDIEIDGHKYIWNSEPVDWVNSPNSINEIGSIHTIQGYDLNYTGLIIGKDIKYDTNTNKIYVDRTEYRDRIGKTGINDIDLLDYILNIYITMCTRGMRGTYLYVCDENLRNYISKYVEIYNKNNKLLIAEKNEEYK